MALETQRNPSLPESPLGWSGSEPEWAVYWALVRLGLKDGEDFTYQASFAGGRQDYGGVVLDFYVHNLGIAINVHSVYFHYLTEERRVADIYGQAMVTSWGITIIYIDEEDALRDPIYYVREALQGRDHSIMTGGK